MIKRTGNILLVLTSVAVAFAFAEIGLRTAGIAYPEFNRLDYRLGWAPRPGVEGIHAMEGRARMAINADGFRDADHGTAKPPGVFRIAVLGDSFTEAREVALANTFWKVLEKKLSTCLAASGRRAEVLSFGVNGYGTGQEMIVLENSVWKYAPDAVLLAFFTGNDVWNNSRALDGHSDRPYYVLKGGKLVLDDSNLKTFRFKAKKVWSDVKHGAYNRLRTIQVGRQAYRRIKAALKHRPQPPLEQLSAGLNGDIYKPPADARWREAWAVTEALIRELKARVRAKGADFWIATLTTPIQIFPDAGLRAKAMDGLGVKTLLYPDRRIAALAAAEGIPRITLAPRLRAMAEEAKVNLHGFGRFAGGHWNEAGHRAAGTELANAFCRSYGDG